MTFEIDKIAELFLYDPKAPLIFTSGLFLFLFLGFSLIYGTLNRSTTLRIVYVTLFSLYFYYKCSGIYFLILLFVSVSDFIIGRFLFRSSVDKTRKLLVALSVIINLGMLSYFKYTNFLIDIFNSFVKDPLDFKNIFLPIGISFFVFQSMSYIIDIYRRRIEPLKRWIDYLFYISFFPQLVAGPIVRARDFIPQIHKNPVVVTREMFGEGFCLIIIGLFKKAVISDYISLNFVDRIFDNPTLYTGFENLIGVYGYALQIYCDFSGYSDIAIGLALLLGFHFNKNFDSPYQSATITEFWRRWHISLSSWLKDYLYISLGGNRKGNVRTYVNLLITMTIGGLWHGAALRFVIWGVWHGLSLAIHKMFMTVFPSFKAQGEDMPWWRRIIGVFITFNVVCFGWIFFRADTFEKAGQVLKAIFTNFHAEIAWDFVTGYSGVLFFMILGYIFHFMPQRTERWFVGKVSQSGMLVKSLCLIGIIWFIMQIKSSEIQPFIYFQF